jgi:Kef-type K+ transport system membrane component KefB
MPDLAPFANQLAWPLAIALAWAVGELGHRVLRIPRIALYALVGFVLGQGQGGLLPAASNGPIATLANIAFGLTLFEFGYRINLRWLRHNPWIGITGVAESAATFAVVYFLASLWALSSLTSLLLGALAVLTSPVAVIRVVNEQHSSGQVTERVLHLSAINSVIAVFVFNAIVGYWTYQNSGSLWQAVSSSLLAVLGSLLLGGVFGVVVPALLRVIHGIRDATVAIAIAVVLLVALAQALKLSPVLATLAFGVAARHRRVALSQTQRNFGALGNVLAVVLFLFIATTLEWPRVVTGLWLAVPLVAARSLVKILVVGLFAPISGTTWRKGVLTGIGLTPISAFVILLLQQARYLGIDLVDQVAALAASTLLLELAGPVVIQRALVWAREGLDGDH